MHQQKTQRSRSVSAHRAVFYAVWRACSREWGKEEQKLFAQKKAKEEGFRRIRLCIWRRTTPDNRRFRLCYSRHRKVQPSESRKEVIKLPRVCTHLCHGSVERKKLKTKGFFVDAERERRREKKKTPAPTAVEEKSLTSASVRVGQRRERREMRGEQGCTRTSCFACQPEIKRQCGW